MELPVTKGYVIIFEFPTQHRTAVELAPVSVFDNSVHFKIGCFPCGNATNIFFYRTGTQQIYCVRMRFFSLKFLKKTSSELELVTWEPECMIEPAKTSNC